MNEYVTDDILSKVQKLLALATSPNENEASVAAQKAEELLLKYNLSMSQVADFTGEGHGDVAHRIMAMGVGRYETYQWAAIIATTVAKTTFCRTLIISGGPRRLVFVGRPTDISVAQEIYRYLRDQVLRLVILATQDRPPHINAMRYRNSWLLGCSTRIAERLESAFREKMDMGKPKQESAEPTGDTWNPMAIVALDQDSQKQNQRYIDDKFETTNTKTRSEARHSRAGYENGYDAGNDIKLNREKELKA